MQEQKSRSKKSWKKQDETPELDSLISNLANRSFVQDFVGYSTLKIESKCLNVIPYKDPSTVIAVFESTPFYAEGGGQIGDTGVIYSDNFQADVIDVKKKSNIFLHYLKIRKGELNNDNLYTLEVNKFRRSLIARNHSSVHLLHWALREKLGEHVKQAGSFVSDNLFRLDFTHFKQIDANLLKEIELMINEKIWQSLPVVTEVLSKKEALDRGALAFFEEKYSDTVRVVSIGDFSKELCGGTHVSNTNEINIIKLISEESVASGVRRIVGITSKEAYTYCSNRVESIDKISTLLNSKVEDTVDRIDKLLQEDKKIRLSLDKYIQKELSLTADDIINKYSQSISNINCIAGVFDVESKYFRSLVEMIRNKKKDSIVIAGNDKDRASLIVGVGDSLVQKYSANTILKDLVSFIDGKGGGKKELAQAGGNKKEGFKELFDNLDKIII